MHTSDQYSRNCFESAQPLIYEPKQHLRLRAYITNCYLQMYGFEFLMLQGYHSYHSIYNATESDEILTTVLQRYGKYS